LPLAVKGFSSFYCRQTMWWTRSQY